MSRNILLADDSVTIRKVVELSFMEEDYELTAVSDGSEALAKLGESPPDLVIADVHMGEIGGLEVCRESKQRYPAVPVLLLVGTFEPFDPEDVEKHGADAFLKKPFDSQDLLRQVGSLLARDSEASDEKAEGDTAMPRDEQPEPEDAAPEVAEEGPPDDEENDGAATDRPAVVTAPPASSSGADDTPEVASAGPRPTGLSDEDVDRIAHRVAELIGTDQIREVAWEVVPDMAEVVIKERLRQLESQVEE